MKKTQNQTKKMIEKLILNYVSLRYKVGTHPTGNIFNLLLINKYFLQPKSDTTKKYVEKFSNPGKCLH